MTAMFDYYYMMMNERGGDTTMVWSRGPMVTTCSIGSSAPPVGDRRWGRRELWGSLVGSGGEGRGG